MDVAATAKHGTPALPRRGERSTLVLINGIAEQAETWFRNRAVWGRRFDLSLPDLIAYEDENLHARIRRGLPIDVAYLTDRLERHLDQRGQCTPAILVASSMGCKPAVQYAVRHPERVAGLVLLGPAGLAEREHLPLVEGVRWAQTDTLVRSVFFDGRHADGRLRQHYQKQFRNRRWRQGLAHTVRGTRAFSVRGLLAHVHQPTLVVIGKEDRIVDAQASYEAARHLPAGAVAMLPRCGHAPQIEQARWVNRAVIHFARQCEAIERSGASGARRFPAKQVV